MRDNCSTPAYSSVTRGMNCDHTTKRRCTKKNISVQPYIPTSIEKVRHATGVSYDNTIAFNDSTIVYSGRAVNESPPVNGAIPVSFTTAGSPSMVINDATLINDN